MTSHWQVDPTDDTLIETVVGSHHIAEVGDRENAPLVAAAPELLIACEAMIHAAKCNDSALGGVAATLADLAVSKATASN